MLRTRRGLLAPRSIVSVGEVVAKRYEVLTQLGKGGTASLHLAVARGPGGFNKLVVLKTPRLEGESAPISRSFLREARVSARLEHPNLVQTFEVIQAHRLPVIVMEYLQGQPLSKVVVASSGAAGGFALHHELRVLVDVLRGLHYAHELTDFDGARVELVHQDVSPQNVFVTYDGQAKVLDFGLARLARLEAGGGSVCGKLRYMSPEQLLGQAVDRRSDVFSVGIMLWEALTGERFWHGFSDREVCTELVSGRVSSPRQLRPDIPTAVEAVCLRALSHHPADRYATARDFEDALRASLKGWKPLAEAHDIAERMEQLFSTDRVRTERLLQSVLASSTLRAHGRPSRRAKPRATPTGLALAANSTQARAQSAITTSSTPPSVHHGVLVAATVGIVLLMGLGLGWGTASSTAKPLPSASSDRSSRMQAFESPKRENTRHPQITPAVAPDRRPNRSRDSSAPADTQRGQSATSAIVSPGPTATSATTTQSTASAPSAPTSSDPTSLPPNCETLFYYDEQGIKRFDRRCVR